MTHRTVIRLFAGGLFAAFALGCGDDTPTSPTGPFLTVDPSFLGVDEGATTQLTATLGGDPVNVTWESSDESIATVSPTGLVTGTSGGRAAITAHLASDPAQARSASITVIATPTLALGKTQTWDGISSGTLARDEGRVIRFKVPAGAALLTVTFTGGTGDGDIYVQEGSAADVNGEDATGCHSFNAANDEECTVDNPIAGTYYVFIAVYDPYSGAKLTATIK